MNFAFRYMSTCAAAVKHCTKATNPRSLRQVVSLFCKTDSSPAGMADTDGPTPAKRSKRFYNTGHRRVDRLIWIDCEMTGLDVNTRTLVEIACIVTKGDSLLTEVAEGPNLVIHQPEDVLDGMDDWCKNQFAKNGLLKQIQDSSVTMEEAECQVLEFVKEHTEPGKSPLAGNSVGMDRRFIEKYMPKLANHCHYRTVDVSSVKELCRRWYPSDFSRTPPKALNHRALDDIRASIDELRYYRTTIFKDCDME